MVLSRLKTGGNGGNPPPGINPRLPVVDFWRDELADVRLCSEAESPECSTLSTSFFKYSNAQRRATDAPQCAVSLHAFRASSFDIPAFVKVCRIAGSFCGSLLGIPPFVDAWSNCISIGGPTDETRDKKSRLWPDGRRTSQPRLHWHSPWKPEFSSCQSPAPAKTRPGPGSGSGSHPLTDAGWPALAAGAVARR